MKARTSKLRGFSLSFFRGIVYSKGVKREIIKKEAEKSKNRLSEEVEKRRHVLPAEDSSEKVLRYERSIEKSIFQKIVMIKNLQRSDME